VVIDGGPDLGGGPLTARRDVFRKKFDKFRSAVVNEPRGSDAWVGALLCEPVDPTCAAGVIFFNNVGYLGMCGHGVIGLTVVLRSLGRIDAGQHRIETPVGIVTVEFDGGNVVAMENVPSYRHTAAVTVDVDEIGPVTGDVAWGGNWFFLVSEHGQDLNLANTPRLTQVAWHIRQALRRERVTGAGGQEIDHIELFGPPSDPAADSCSFVLCPGSAYDRSPCGTGTSAKLACLAADGRLKPRQRWRQESIVGSVFEGSYRIEGDRIIPRIQGTAYVIAEATLILNGDDPFETGIRT